MYNSENRVIPGEFVVWDSLRKKTELGFHPKYNVQQQ